MKRIGTLVRLVVLGLLLALAAACAPKANPWLERSDITVLEDKVKANRNAYFRMRLAEEEATREGALAAAEKYRLAKEEAYRDYLLYNERLTKALADRLIMEERARERRTDK